MSITTYINIKQGVISFVLYICFVLIYPASAIASTSPQISTINDHSTNEDTAINSISFTANDIESLPCSLNLTITSSNQTILPDSNISYICNADNYSITANPALNQNGSVLITVLLKDNNGLTASTSFNLNINPRNDPPVNIVIPSISGIYHAGEKLSLDIGTWNDSNDQLPGTLTYTYKWQLADDASGTNAVDISTYLTYNIPLSDNNKYIRAQITVLDNGEGLPVPQRTTVNTAWTQITNTAPVFKESSPQFVIMDEDCMPKAFALTLNAIDADNDPISWTVISNASNGKVKLDRTGTSQSIHYTPDSNYSGSDSFIIQIEDDISVGETLSVNVTINPSNDPPVYTVSPVVSGMYHMGKTLAVSRGDWNDNIDKIPGSLTYNYQWQRADDASGSNTINLSTFQIYTIELKDHMHYIRAQITATDDGEGLPLNQSTTFNTDWCLVTNSAPLFTESSPITINLDEDSQPIPFSLTLNATDNDDDTIFWTILKNATHGKASVNAIEGTKQSINYLPMNNYHGTDTFSIQISDSQGETDTFTVNLSINPRNDPPVNTVSPSISGIYHVGETLSLNKGSWHDNTDLTPGTLTYNYQWQRSDDDNGINTVILGNNQTYDIKFADNSKYIRAEVTVTDNGEGLPLSQSTVCSTNWTFISNTAPEFIEISPQFITLDEDNLPTPFNLTLNATDPDNDLINWTVLSNASEGTVSVSGTGNSQAIYYTPLRNYSGNDSFILQISDGLGGVDRLTVNLSINPRNDPPVNTFFPIISGVHHVGNMLSIDHGNWNDSNDNEPGNLSYTYQWQSADNTSGTNTLYIGSDQTYTVTLADNNRYIRAQITATDDGEGLPLTQSTLLHTPWKLISNAAPVFTESSPQSVILDEDNHPNPFALTLNALDTDNDLIYWTVLSSAKHGTVTVSGTGISQAILYTPINNYNGSDSFILQISDGLGGVDTLTVNMSINPRNDPPINSINPSISGIYHVGKTLTINQGIWSDSNDQTPGTLSFIYQWQRADDATGTNKVNIGNNQTYTLALEDHSQYIRAQITAIDNGEGLPSAQTITLNTAWAFISNSAPVFTEINPQIITMDEDSLPIPFNLTLNATDADNDPIIWTVLSNASHGTASVSGTGSKKNILYTPNNNYSGSDIFRIQISDALGGIDKLTVSITINPRNDPPVNTVIPEISGIYHVGETLAVNSGTWNDNIDKYPGALYYSYQWQRADDVYGANITSIGSNQNYTISFEDNAHYIRAQITATDNSEGLPLTQSTAIHTAWTFVSNIAPVFTETSPQSITMDEDSLPIPFSLILNATDSDDDPIIWSILSNASHGTATVNGTGISKSILYTPVNNYNGTDTFSIQISDGLGGKDTLSVNLNINPRNDPPINSLSPDISGIFHMGQMLTIQHGSWHDNNDQSPGALIFSYRWQRAEDDSDTNIINIGNNQSYTLTLADNKSYIRAQIIATDNGEGLPSIQSTGIYTSWKFISNIAPVFTETSPQTITMDEDSFPIKFSLTLHAIDDDNDPIYWKIFSNASHGKASVNGAGSEKAIMYTPVNNYNGLDSFSVQISDELGGENTLTVNLKIMPRNDPPINILMPSISGIYHVGKTLTLDIGSWNDKNDQIPGTVSFNYQWQRADDDSGTNTVNLGSNKNYQLIMADNARYIRAEITATDDGEGLPLSQKTIISTSWQPVENDGPVFSEASPLSITMDEDSFPEPFKLSITANDTDGDELQWSVSSQAMHGIASVTGTGTQKNIFYTPTLNYNGLDSFDIQVSDSIDQNATLTIQVVIQAINDAPILSPNNPNMTDITEDDINNSGELVSSIIGNSVTDTDMDALQGIAIYEIDHSNGQWEYSLDSGVNWLALSDVSQITALLLGTQDKIRFVPDQKNADKAQFSYHAWDQTSGMRGSLFNVTINGNISAISSDSDICFIMISDINDRPYVANNNDIAVNEGTSILITNAYLSINDPDNVSEDLVFISHSIEPPGHGSLFCNEIKLTENTSFTQADIEDNLITYSHPDGEINLVQILFTVSDGQKQLTEILFDIHIIPVNDPPQIINNKLLCTTEGEEKIIEEKHLKVSDIDNTDDEIYYYLTKIPENGSLYLNGEAQKINNVFSQEDINTSNLFYKHNGTESQSDHFSFTITDSMGIVIPENSFFINITNNNDTPILVNNAGLILPEGGHQIILESILLVTDEDNTAEELTYMITDLPDFGSIHKNNKALTGNHFTQQDILDKAISYVHDDSENRMDSFSFVINDPSGASLNNTKFSITISPINDKPDISKINDIITKEDFDIDAISFEINDSETLPDDIQISWHTSYPVLIPDSNITVNGSGKNKKLYLNLNPDTSGTSIITLTITDAGGLSDSESFTLIVQPVDDPPKIQIPLEDVFVIEDAKKYTLDLNKLFTDVDNEDSSILISILNNTHTSPDILNLSIVSNILYLNFIENANGESVVQIAGYSNGLSATTSFIVRILPVNDVPVVKNASIHLFEDHSINGQVIAHDVDQDNLTFNILALPEKGAITLNSTTGQFIYVPYANKNGNDFFTFQANDSHTDSSLATISISITPVNDSPLITDMQRQGNENKAYYFTSSDFSDEFSDIDLDSISSIKITHLPEFGNLCQHESPISLSTELSLFDLSALNFKPLTDWSGKTSFTWKAFDGTNWSENEASVILEINADPLVIGPIIKSGTEDNYLYFDDVDFQKYNFNSKCYIKIVSLPLHGNLYFDIQKISQDHFFDGTPVYTGQEWHISDFLLGKLVFLPDLNFNGLTSFLWSARKNNIWTDEEIVKIEILPINDRPEITSLYKEALEDTAIEFVAKDFTDIYHDIENDPLYEISFNQLPAPDMGQLMLKGKAVIKGNPIANTELDQLVFEPSMHGNGEILCTFIASDSMSWSITPAELKILIIPVGDTPRVPNITSLEDTATEPIIIQKHIKDGLEIKSFFIDHIMGGHLFMADGTTLITNQSFINTNDALKGVIFMPDQNRTNECGFDTWSSEDSQNLAAQSDAAHVSIRIIPVDDPPYVANALPAVNLPEDAALVEYDLTDVFTDVDNDLALMEYKIKVISNPDLLTAHISNQKLSLEFYPNAHGIADILIEAHSNGKISQDYCYVTINPVQDVPIAENIHIQTLENIPVSSNLIAHDADEDSLTFQIIKNGDKGLLSIHPQSGAFTYTPTKNMNGKDSFTFNAYDGIEHSNTATVSVYITAVNNDPLVDNFTMYGTEDTLLTFDLTDFSSAFTDIDDDLLYKIKIISLPDSSLGNLLINDISLLIHTELTHSEISNLYFMPRPNQFGVTEFLWQAFDGKSWSSSTGKCQIEISSVNDQPVAIDSQIFTGKQGDTIFGQLSFEDVDDDILDFSIQRQPEYGQLVLNNSESGQFMYIPDNDHIHLSDNFSYHIFDGHVYSNTANVYFSFEKNTPEEPPLIVRLYGDYNDGDIYTLTLISPETGEVVFNENGSTYELVLHISPGTYRLILFGKNYKPLDYPELIVLGEDTLICDLNLETDPFSSFYPGIEVSHIENSNGFKLCVIKKNIYELKMTIRTSDNEEIPVFEPSYERSLQNNHGTVADPYYYIWTPSDPITQRTVQSITDQVTTYTVAFNFYDVFNPSETISSYTVIYQQFASPIDQKASQSETQFLFETPKESGGVYGESTLYIASGETNFYPLIGTTLHLTVKDTSGQDRLLSITIPPIPLKYMYLAHTDYLEYDLESDLITIENPGPHIQNNDLFKAIVHCYTFGGTAIGTGIQLHFEMAAGKYKGIEVMYNPMINGQRANFMDDENAPFIDIPMLLNPLSESYTQLVNKPDVWLYVQEKGDQEKGFRAEKLLVPAETNDDGLVYIKMNHLTAVGLGMGKMPFVEEEDKPVDDSSDGENSNCFLGTIWR